MKPLLRPLSMTVLLWSCLPLAQAAETSLLGPAGYPKHSCSKPSLPNLPGEVKTQSELLMYDAQVRQYNQQAKIYTDCINAYLKVAGDDARRIQSLMDEAVAEANAR